MQVYKAFKFRLYPNEEQKNLLEQHFGHNRFVYNFFLRARILYYEKYKDSNKRRKGLSYYDTAKLLTKLKKKKRYEWLSDVDSQSLQQSLMNLDTAYKNFFKNGFGFPKFKKKHDKQSFRVVQHFSIDAEAGRLNLSKINPIKMIIDRPTEGAAKGATISKNKSGQYFASILCEVEIKPKKKKEGRSIGIDLGLKDFVVTSDKERIKSPKYFKESARRLAKVQQKFSRTTVGSNRHEKARLKVARAYNKITNQRKDFLHKLSRGLVDESQAIYVEDLGVKEMLEKSNRSLARSISDAGWGEFVRQLEYKSLWYGCNFTRIDSFFPSSKRHYKCGYVNYDLALADRMWTCNECGKEVDRDLNAAKNIRSYGRFLESRRAGTARTQRSRRTLKGSSKREAP